MHEIFPHNETNNKLFKKIHVTRAHQPHSHTIQTENKKSASYAHNFTWMTAWASPTTRKVLWW